MFMKKHNTTMLVFQPEGPPVWLRHLFDALLLSTFSDARGATD